MDFFTYFFSLVTFLLEVDADSYIVYSNFAYIHNTHMYVLMYVCVHIMYVYVYMKSLMHRCGRNVGDQNAHRNAF